MDILGIDIGFGFTKATDGNDSTIFKSLIGEATDIQFKSNIEDNSFSENLHITVDNKSYFIGSLAELQSNVRQFTLDQEKLVAEYVKILALTAAGNFAEKPAAPLNVVSGLPVAYLKQYYKRFTSQLAGTHDIIFHKPDGTKISKKIYISKVKMMPQPLGSIFNLLMSDQGRIVNQDLKKQKVAVVDIGFRTTDFTIFDQLRYIERGSSSIDVGISKSFSIIANKLKELSGVHVELYRLYKSVDSGVIKIKGQQYNITNLTEQIFANTAEAIANEVNQLWSDDWDIDTIILTGGGSAPLAKYLESMIDGNVIPVDPKVDARMNNVRGYIKYGKFEWGNGEVSNKE